MRTPGQVGLSLAYYGVGFALVQGWLIRIALARLGRGVTMGLGFTASVVSFSILVWIADGGWALVLIPVSTLSGLVMPALRAEMSDRVSAAHQGELQGALASLHAVGMIGAPFVYTWTFASFVGDRAILDLPGAVFAIPAMLSLLALWLLWRPATERTPA